MKKKRNHEESKFEVEFEESLENVRYYVALGWVYGYDGYSVCNHVDI